MNIFFEEEGEEHLRSNLKTLEQPTHYHKRREDAKKEKDAQGEVMPKERGCPSLAHA